MKESYAFDCSFRIFDGFEIPRKDSLSSNILLIYLIQM